MKKLISLVILAPLAIILIVLSVANRHPVTFNLDPINPEQPFLALTLPFFVYLFVTLIGGLFLGSLITWFTQSKYRKMARENRREAEKWHQEADEQKERADQIAGTSTQLIAAELAAKSSSQSGHAA